MRPFRLAGPWWVALGLVQLLATGAGLFFWVVVTTQYHTGGLTRDWVAGGWGILVVGYAGSIGVAGVALIRHRAARLIGWLELTAVPLLVLVAILAAQGAFGGGAVLFYLPMAGAVGALAVVAAGAGASILMRQDIRSS